jgi:hypothetical protein
MIWFDLESTSSFQFLPNHSKLQLDIPLNLKSSQLAFAKSSVFLLLLLLLFKKEKGVKFWRITQK